VHTLGTLIEGGEYKEKVRRGDVIGLLGDLLGGGAGNPLNEKRAESSYETLNRDAALRVCEAFTYSQNRSSTSIRPFIYISAEDIFRPIIPARYITTKREAELGIEEIIRDKSDSFRAAYIRPSLVYHAHHRPLTSPLAALLDLSATIHSNIPQNIPTPSGLLRVLGSSIPSSSIPPVLDSMANALTIPPIHVEHVAEAIIVALTSDVRGVVDVRRMRKLIGWKEKASDNAVHA